MKKSRLMEINDGFNFDNLSNLSVKINDTKVSRGKYNVKPKLPKSTISLIINSESFLEFEKRGMAFFKENKAKSEYSAANFFRIILINMNHYLIDKYEDINVSEDDVNFLKNIRKNRADIVDLDYPHFKETIKKYTLTMERKFIDLAYEIASKFYLEEMEMKVDLYTINMFFYDVLDMIEKDVLKLKFYTKAEITDFIEEY